MFISLNAKKDIDRFRKRGVVKFLNLNLLHKKFSLFIHSLGNLFNKLHWYRVVIYECESNHQLLGFNLMTNNFFLK